MADALADSLGPMIEQVIKDARPILKQGKKLARQSVKGEAEPSGKHRKTHRLRNLVLLLALVAAGAVGYKKVQG